MCAKKVVYRGIPVSLKLIDTGKMIHKDGVPFYVFSVLLFVLALLMNWVMGLVAYAARVKNPQLSVLHDVILDNWATVYTTGWPDGMMYADLAATFAITLLTPRPLFVCGRYLRLLGTVLLMRAVTVASTSYPDPSFDCAGDDPEGGLIIQQCGSLMFSGHTTVFMCSALINTWVVYRVRCSDASSLAWFILNVLYVTAGITGVLVCRLHYGPDVEVAIFLSVTTYLGLDAIESMLTCDCCYADPGRDYSSLAYERK
jgi:hypothetical protein